MIELTFKLKLFIILMEEIFAFSRIKVKIREN